MILLGLTGGIGSGKSWVANILRTHNIPVYVADDRAKALMQESEPVRAAVMELFGDIAYLPDGRLNRKEISEQVFRDSRLLTRLNAIVHPATRTDFELWCSMHRRQHTPVVAKEAAILYEAGSHLGLDAVCMVYAPLSLRLQRVMARDQVTIESVLARIANQWPDQRKCLLADFVIYNDGVHEPDDQVNEMLQRLCLTGSGR